MATMPFFAVPRSSTAPSLGLDELLVWSDERFQYLTRPSQPQPPTTPLEQPEKAVIQDQNGAPLASPLTGPSDYASESASTLVSEADEESVRERRAARKWKYTKYCLGVSESITWLSPCVTAFMLSRMTHEQGSGVRRVDLRTLDATLIGGTLLFYLLAALFLAVFPMFSRRRGDELDRERRAYWFRGAEYETEEDSDLDAERLATIACVRRRMLLCGGLTLWWLAVEFVTVYATTTIL